MPRTLKRPQYSDFYTSYTVALYSKNTRALTFEKHLFPRTSLRAAMPRALSEILKSQCPRLFIYLYSFCVTCQKFLKVCTLVIYEIMSQYRELLRICKPALYCCRCCVLLLPSTAFFFLDFFLRTLRFILSLLRAAPALLHHHLLLSPLAPAPALSPRVSSASKIKKTTLYRYILSCFNYY